jgi:hypothetical protein
MAPTNTVHPSSPYAVLSSIVERCIRAKQSLHATISEHTGALEVALSTESGAYLEIRFQRSTNMDKAGITTSSTIHASISNILFIQQEVDEDDLYLVDAGREIDSAVFQFHEEQQIGEENVKRCSASVNMILKMSLLLLARR